MARYIDADKAKELWSGDHPTQIAMRRIFDDLSTADVVPKSEVEELKAIIADHKASEERLEELYSNTKAEVEKLREINSLLTEAGQEWQKRYENLGREIFEEIKGVLSSHYHSDKITLDDNALMIVTKHSARHCIAALLQDIAELEKKYTEKNYENVQN